jgi:hypothetical protein
VRSGGKRVAGAVRCSAKVGGRSLPHATPIAVAGRASCTWTLPATARGKLVTGSVTESYEGSKVSRGFFARVR